MTRPTPLRLALRAAAGMAYAFAIHAALRGGGALPAAAAGAALLVPALVSLLLLLAFARSLRPGAEPMIVVFAHAMERDPIPPRILAWLRRVTVAWCVFFAANAAVSAALAVFAPIGWWTLWNGVLAYLLVGLLLLAEYVVRKIRFRWYRGGVLDRGWRRVFPPFDDSSQGSGRSSSVT